MLFKKKKKTPGGLAVVHKPFIAHVTGEVWTPACNERYHSSSCLRLIIRGPVQTKAARVQVARTYRWTRDTLPQCGHAERKVKKQSQDKKQLPKKESYNPFPKQYTFLPARETPWWAFYHRSWATPHLTTLPCSRVWVKRTRLMPQHSLYTIQYWPS